MEIIGISLELFGIIGILKNSKNSKEFYSDSNYFLGNSKIPNFLKKASHLAYVGAWVLGGEVRLPGLAGRWHQKIMKTLEFLEFPWK